MDVIVCNGFGAYLGMKTCEYLGNKVSSLTDFFPFLQCNLILDWVE